MNWFRFKVELSAWAAKVVLCVITTLLMCGALFQAPGTRDYPLSMRLVAENQWVFPLGFTTAVVVMWVSYWRIFGIYRGRTAYGGE